MNLPLLRRSILAVVCIGLPVGALLTGLAVVSPTSCTRPQDEVLAREMTRAQLLRVAEAVSAHAAAHDGEYPDTHDGLGGIVADLPEGRLPMDAWGQPLLYFSPPPHGGAAAFELISLGRDGSPGGEGDDADLRHLSTDTLAARGGP